MVVEKGIIELVNSDLFNLCEDIVIVECEHSFQRIVEEGEARLWCEDELEVLLKNREFKDKYNELLGRANDNISEFGRMEQNAGVLLGETSLELGTVVAVKYCDDLTPAQRVSEMFSRGWGGIATGGIQARSDDGDRVSANSPRQQPDDWIMINGQFKPVSRARPTEPPTLFETLAGLSLFASPWALPFIGGGVVVSTPLVLVGGGGATTATGTTEVVITSMAAGFLGTVLDDSSEDPSLAEDECPVE